MLVCNVSMRPRGMEIAAEIAETVTATDATASGYAVFATLVDDPASVSDTVDAYLGEIMLEAASADDAVSLVALIDAAVDEATTAADTQDATLAIDAAVDEVTTAADSQDAAVAVASVTWDAATVTAVTLSGGNLVATNTGTTSADQGARVAAASGKTTGKYYFEITRSSLSTSTNHGVGIGTTASTYTNLGNSATTGDLIYMTAGTIWANGASSGITLGAVGNGTVLGIAVDLGNRKIWFKKVSAPPGNWNNSGTADPATNVGGITIPAGTMVPIVTFGGGSGVAGIVVTANFGASGFTSAAPSGFTSGWPV